MMRCEFLLFGGFIRMGNVEVVEFILSDDKKKVKKSLLNTVHVVV